MRPSALPVALLAGTAAAASNCTSGLYIVVARGTGEESGTGAFGTVADDIAAKVDDSVVEALDYPATYTDPLYTESEKDGVQEMQDTILDYHEACPDAKFAVLGYSQGGQVSSDAFCGGAGGGFSELAALPADFVTSHFAAIILFGDPSHVANVTYDRGTSINNGIFARDNVTFCEENYADLMRSYCDTGDTYCDSGDVRTVHGSYFATYADDVVDFVVDRYEALKESATTSAAATTATTATTASETSAASETTAAASETSASASVSGSSAPTTASAPSGTSASTAASATASTVSDEGNAASGLSPRLAFAVTVPLALAAFGMVL
ncbi:cutinase-domain-containing protein [Dactylonectria estremocensis]|uniref:Cutinase-domain-containing protein n=1 Tax=Dactylonectria estremocensis TaxID=1079267 RepID=A0A9P9E642_9HYPO|nr:cutinase-domain-containing protein [Dactylonectria estremocensis]